MFLWINDSALLKFALESKPFTPVHQNYDSPEVERLTDNQDNCDDKIEFYHFSIAYLFL
jgi:hypothetical protein